MFNYRVYDMIITNRMLLLRYFDNESFRLESCDESYLESCKCI